MLEVIMFCLKIDFGVSQVKFKEGHSRERHGGRE